MFFHIKAENAVVGAFTLLIGLLQERIRCRLKRLQSDFWRANSKSSLHTSGSPVLFLKTFCNNGSYTCKMALGQDKCGRLKTQHTAPQFVNQFCKSINPRN